MVQCAGASLDASISVQPREICLKLSAERQLLCIYVYYFLLFFGVHPWVAISKHPVLDIGKSLLGMVVEILDELLLHIEQYFDILLIHHLCIVF